MTTTTDRTTTPEPRLRVARWLAAAGIGGAAAAVALVGGLHLVPETAGISPVRRTISEYALTDAGWVFNLGAVVLALGSLAVLAALVLTGTARHRSIGSLLTGGWVAALLVVVLFPKHNWAVGPSLDGHIHRAASVVAFLCLPLAVLMLTRRRRSTAGGRPDQSLAARSAFWLAVISLLWFAPIAGALLQSPVTGTPWWQAIPLGLVERGLVMSEVLAVVALGCWAISESIPPRNPRPASRGRTPRAA